jgi:hypothetical protein
VTYGLLDGGLGDGVLRQLNVKAVATESQADREDRKGEKRERNGRPFRHAERTGWA